MSAVSVVIPNYNGQQLLAKHLPDVLKTMRTGDELVIIDDRSTDDSWAWLQKEFGTESVGNIHIFEGLVAEGKWSAAGKKGSVLLLQNQENQRFAVSCNRAVEQASQPLVFLINTDVSPHPKSLQNAVKHFEDDSVFAVGFLEHEKNSDNKDVLGGKNEISFQRGMFIHRRAENFETGPNAWASGGSSVFDRQKWLELGGFDPEYYPAYWEDVDLSFRAKERGWKVLFDATAEVDHNHESTNSTAFGQKKMTKMSWQHAQTFVTKNANWKQKLQYLLWQPYWWVKGPTIAPQQLQIIYIGLIILVASLLRFYQLANVPHGMTWDEAAIGYNGWSVATKGRDEWLTKLPISFKSFGDYKAPLAIYIVGGFTRIFGLNLFAIRLPFALSGVAAVIGMMVLVKILWEAWPTSNSPKIFPSLTSTNAAILAGALMAVSPWHVHFSRIGFESGIALNFLIWGVAGLLWLLTQREEENVVQQKAKKLWKVVVALFSAVSIACSLYTYHSSKIVAPLLLVMLVGFFIRPLLRNWRNAILWCVLIGALLVPLLYDTVYGMGGNRFQQASVFRLGLNPLQLLTTLFQHFFIHFSPGYLVQGQTETLRHGDGQYGILFASEFFLMLLGFAGTIQIAIKKIRNHFPLRIALFAALWVIIGVLPAAIGVDVPHSNRMLLALPGFILFAVLGWQWVAETFTDGLVAPAILGMTLLIQIFLVCSYLNHYYTVFAKTSANEFEDGYMEAVKYAVQYEPSVDRILFTTQYQQPYIYTLIGRKTTPYEYHAGSLIKYLFVDKINSGDLSQPNTLIVATPQQLDPSLGDHLVYGSDGQVRFVIVKTP